MVQIHVRPPNSMEGITHNQQKAIWEKEHRNPYLLPTMDHDGSASSGTERFWQWLQKQELDWKDMRGIEAGCGKGRNCIFLAKQGMGMTGFDFSQTAISAAHERSQKSGVQDKVQFIMHDATIQWPFANRSFIIGIDNFASSDIENLEGRTFVRDEFLRVLKPKACLFVYALSADDQFLKSDLVESLYAESNTYRYYATGKFEKAYSEEEILDFYRPFKLIEKERIEKTATFFNKEYQGKHFWLVFQK